jgi:hypothetical protein
MQKLILALVGIAFFAIGSAAQAGQLHGGVVVYGGFGSPFSYNPPQPRTVVQPHHPTYDPHYRGRKPGYDDHHRYGSQRGRVEVGCPEGTLPLYEGEGRYKKITDCNERVSGPAVEQPKYGVSASIECANRQPGEHFYKKTVDGGLARYTCPK